MLEETGIDYELELVDLRGSERKDSPEFLEASPMGKVPALVDGAAHMSESAAICLYLADRYCADKLAPAVDDSSRGKFLYWLMYTPAVVEPSMAEKFSGSETNRGRNGWGDFDAMISTWEHGLADSDWILGDVLSAADVMLGSSAVFLQMFGMMPESPQLQGYAERCMARDAYKKAIAIQV